MDASLDRATEIPSQQGDETHESTGLDYSTCYRIGEDVPSRIRALLLSRHAYCPPRTPWPSDETFSGHQEKLDNVDGFDFSTARSIAQFANIESGHLISPSTRHRIFYTPEVLPASQLNKHPILRGSSSTGDLRTPSKAQGADEVLFIMDDARIHDTLTTPYPPSLPAEVGRGIEKASVKFRIPARRHFNLNRNPSKVSPVRLRSNEAAVLPPSPGIPTDSLPNVLQIRPEADGDDRHQPGCHRHELSYEIISKALSETKATAVPLMHPSPNDQIDVTGRQLGSRNGDGLPVVRTSSSIDSLGLVGAEERRLSLSSPVLHVNASKSSLQSKFQAQSVGSGASGTTAHRHALLKPSNTVSQSIDLGLPIQPVLTRASDIPALNSEAFTVFEESHEHGPPLQMPEVALKNLMHPTESKDTALGLEKIQSSAPSSLDNALVSLPVQPGRAREEGDQVRPSECYAAVGHPLEESKKTFPGQEHYSRLESTLPKNSSECVFVTMDNLHDDLSIIIPQKSCVLKSYTSGIEEKDCASADSQNHYEHRHSSILVNNYAERMAERAPHTSIHFLTSVKHKEAASYTDRSIADPPNQFNMPSRSSNGISDQNSLADKVLATPKLSENSIRQASTEFKPAPLQSRGNVTEVPKSKWNIGSSKNPHNINRPSRHSSIPSRLSSLDPRGEPTRRTSKSTASQSKVVQQLSSKTAHRPKPTPSMGSMKSGFSLTPHRQYSGLHDDDSGSNRNMNQQISLHWLRDLLSDRGYSPRLTALPLRMHRRARAEVRDNPDSRHRSIARVRDQRLEPQSSETFTKTINDLEHLLNEALHIARQATEVGEGVHQPDLLNDATAVLQTGREIFTKDTVQRRPDKRIVLLSNPRSRPLSKISSLDSIHESVRSVSEDATSHSSCGSFSEAHSLSSDHRVLSFRDKIGSNTPVVRHNSASRTLGHQSKPLNRPWLAGLVSKIRIISKKRRDTEGSERTATGGIAAFTDQKDDEMHRATDRSLSDRVQSEREVMITTHQFYQPPIKSRDSSLSLRKNAQGNPKLAHIMTSAVNRVPAETECTNHELISPQAFSPSCPGSSTGSESEVDFSTPEGFRKHAGPTTASNKVGRFELEDSFPREEALPKRHISGRRLHDKLQHLKHDKFSHLNLRGKSHISLRGRHEFSLSRSHRRQPIARDWSPSRKRFVASVACISTALIGILIGIYAGEVPSIQYYIADFNHFAILGNVFFFIGLAISTFLFWPLPLLHGRKPYVLTAMTIAMPLLFPQAVAVGSQRSPYVATYRIGLILPRTFMGLALGLANMNFMATLTDLFGASLQSGNPHQEMVDENDVRRHGGGLGVWLGIWTWCYMGSIGVGFLIGALVINSLSPDWGFYVSIVIIAAVLLLNVVTPEVRRAAFRRSIAEVRTSTNVSHRLARGEVMMHRLQTGPKWWGEEFHHGVMLSLEMLRQPGFLVMSFYVAWMYGQIVLVIVLLGSLMSKYYRFTSPYVGLTTMAIPFGALLAVPFQKASLFSRSRHHAQRTDSGTFDRRITITSHLIRRAIFTLVLPFAGLAYTLSSGGPPTPFILPVLFAGLIGFLSNLAIAECNGIIMEAFDTSDLQPGMTGRPRGASGRRTSHKRTNYSSFPRVSAAFAIIQSLGFLIGAAATGVGGVAERQLGQKAATGVMAGILLILTLAVLGVLARWKEVQIIPTHNHSDMEAWERERLRSIQRRQEAARRGISTPEVADADEPWRPVIIGHPSGKTRRMSILELGHLSRWSEIRRKNKLVDEMGYEGRHPNLATLADVRKEIREKNLGSLKRDGSRRSRRSQLSQGSEEVEVGSVELEQRGTTR